MKRWAPVLTVIALIAVACSSGSDSSGAQTINPSESHAPVTLSMWSEWTSAAETKVFNKIFDGFQQKYPWITVDSRTGLTDNKITAAINSGQPPDSVLSFGVDNVGLWCSTGAWIDMTPYINGPDGVDMTSTFPPSALTYTSYNGNQCALPFLTDVTGMYYNLDMFKAAGISDPPKTTDELMADAKKLTQFNSDGSIKVAGFVPWLGYNCCGNTSLSFGHMFGATWLDDQGNPAFASDPRWAEMFDWQKKFIAEVYGGGDFQAGSDKLQRFIAGTADEFSSENDFEIGRVAITMDGEWRAGPNFIGLDAPDLNYDTAPLPTSPDNTAAYGSGVAGGTVDRDPAGFGARGRGVVADEVHGHRHEHPRVHGEQRVQRADDERLARLARPELRPAVPDVPGRVQEPVLRVPADVADRGRPRDVPGQLRRRVADGQEHGSAGRFANGDRSDPD